jgi:hypothetical protein
LIWVVRSRRPPISVAIDLALGVPLGLFGRGLTWGIATSVMATEPRDAWCGEIDGRNHVTTPSASVAWPPGFWTLHVVSARD